MSNLSAGRRSREKRRKELATCVSSRSWRLRLRKRRRRSTRRLRPRGQRWHSSHDRSPHAASGLRPQRVAAPRQLRLPRMQRQHQQQRAAPAAKSDASGRLRPRCLAINKVLTFSSIRRLTLRAKTRQDTQYVQTSPRTETDSSLLGRIALQLFRSGPTGSGVSALCHCHLSPPLISAPRCALRPAASLAWPLITSRARPRKPPCALRTLGACRSQVGRWHRVPFVPRCGPCATCAPPRSASWRLVLGRPQRARGDATVRGRP